MNDDWARFDYEVMSQMWFLEQDLDEPWCEEQMAINEERDNEYNERAGETVPRNSDTLADRLNEQEEGSAGNKEP